MVLKVKTNVDNLEQHWSHCDFWLFCSALVYVMFPVFFLSINLCLSIALSRFIFTSLSVTINLACLLKLCPWFWKCLHAKTAFMFFRTCLNTSLKLPLKYSMFQWWWITFDMFEEQRLSVTPRGARVCRVIWCRIFAE